MTLITNEEMTVDEQTDAVETVDVAATDPESVVDPLMVRLDDVVRKLDEIVGSLAAIERNTRRTPIPAPEKLEAAETLSIYDM